MVKASPAINLVFSGWLDVGYVGTQVAVVRRVADGVVNLSE
ncbi:MAG TPA: hypothetical protein VLA19_04305 [Herpetosiphonaceae bacterium]|nr:hypothetical protein [Herpetosiphonaceae bacterium]